MPSTNDLIEQRIGLAANTNLRTDVDLFVRQLDDPFRFNHTLAITDESSAAWQSVINALAIGETYFFRDRAHFQLLRSHILPALMIQRRQTQTLNIWSAGCATGEEVYSLAILLYEFLPDAADWNVRLIGTDVNARALEIARRAVYRPWSFRHTEPALMRYFTPVEGGMQLKPFIRDRVTFRHGNLFGGPPLPRFDIILCRNVLLYFSPERAEAAEALLYDALVPGGWLLLGASEGLRSRRHTWVTHIFPGTPVFQKASRPDEPFMRQHNSLLPEIVPDLPITPNYEAAVRAFHNDNTAAAAEILAEVLLAEPHHAPAHTLLACVLANQRSHAVAYHHLDLALRADPLLADAHYLRALLYLDDQLPDQARKSLQQALYCQRNHPLASYTLGLLMAQTGEATRAARLWENARRAVASLTPESPLSDLSDITAGRLLALMGQQAR